MVWFFRILMGLVCVALCGVVAIFTAGTMADAGMLGSCFEGACAYGAIFLVFPILWVALSVISILILWRLMRRRKSG